MSKKLFAIITTFILILSLTGCQLAQGDSQISKTDSREDLIIGVFITQEHLDLFDIEGYLNDNPEKISSGEINVEDASEYQGRLYATLTTKSYTDEKSGETSEEEEYVFGNIEGITFFAPTIWEEKKEDRFTRNIFDEAISDGKLSVDVGDEGNTTILEGTIYVSPKNSEESIYYFNPVFQDAEGKVYIAGGIVTGAFINGESEGECYTHTIDSTTKITENDISEQKSTSVNISLSVLFPPEKITVLEMSKDSTIVSRNEYNPGTLPDTLYPNSDAEYIIVETYKHDPEGNSVISRSVTNKGDENLNTFYFREDGVCIKQWTELQWGN